VVASENDGLWRPEQVRLLHDSSDLANQATGWSLGRDEKSRGEEMRNIKFRGKRLDNGDMINQNLWR